MLFRRRVAVGGAALVGSAVAAGSADEEMARTLTIASIGTACRAFLRSTCSLTVHDGHHFEAALARQRSPGKALLTVSNHIATIDDPHLIAAIVPPRVLLRGGKEMRWGVCGHDVCFKVERERNAERENGT